MLISVDDAPARQRLSLKDQGENDDEPDESIGGFYAGGRNALGPSQRRGTKARSQSAVHYDHSGDFSTAMAVGIPARWPHADHRKGRTRLASVSERRKDSSQQCAPRLLSGPERHVGRLCLAPLRD